MKKDLLNQFEVIKVPINLLENINQVFQEILEKPHNISDKDFLYIVHPTVGHDKNELTNCTETNLKEQKKPRFQWTGDIIHLVELGYALIETESINDGEVEVGAFMNYLGECFNVEIKRPSDFYYKIRLRGGNRTIFLDKLKKYIEIRMDRNDEKNYRK